MFVSIHPNWAHFWLLCFVFIFLNSCFVLHLFCWIWQSSNVGWAWLSDCFGRLSPNLCCLFQDLLIKMCSIAVHLQRKHDLTLHCIRYVRLPIPCKATKWRQQRLWQLLSHYCQWCSRNRNLRDRHQRWPELSWFYLAVINIQLEKKQKLVQGRQGIEGTGRLSSQCPSTVKLAL